MQTAHCFRFQGLLTILEAWYFVLCVSCGDSMLATVSLGALFFSSFSLSSKVNAHLQSDSSISQFPAHRRKKFTSLPSSISSMIYLVPTTDVPSATFSKILSLSCVCHKNLCHEMFLQGPFMATPSLFLPSA